MFFPSDPYGYNEKKRRREHLMKISGLSGKQSGTLYTVQLASDMIACIHASLYDK